MNSYILRAFLKQLMKVTEEKLFSVLPEKEKNKAFRLKTQASPHEIMDAESGLNAWQKIIQTEDKNSMDRRKRSAGMYSSHNCSCSLISIVVI